MFVMGGKNIDRMKTQVIFNYNNIDQPKTREQEKKNGYIYWEYIL